MSPHLNLAALTGEELAGLLGEGAAQKLLPDITRARIERKPFPGPAASEDLRFERLEAREWGASAEQTRRLRALHAALLALGYEDHGAYYAPGVLGARHSFAFSNGEDTAATVRWSETPESASGPPFVQLLTLLRDRASGFAAVLTTTSAFPLFPSPSDEVAVRLVLAASPEEAHVAHRAELARHGRGTRQSSLADWEAAWHTLRHLNLAAWERRGLLIPESSRTKEIR